MVKKTKSLFKTLAVTMAAVFALSAAAVGSASVSAAPSDDIAPVVSRQYGIEIVDKEDYITGVRAAYSDPADQKAAIDAANNYVTAVDNSKLKYFPGISCQAHGSCATWSSVYYQVTHAINKKMDRAASKETTLNPLFIYSLIAKGTDTGSWPWDVFDLVGSNGCPTYADLADSSGFKSWRADYDVWRSANDYRITSYFRFANIGGRGSAITSPTDPDLEPIKCALRGGELVSFLSYLSSLQRAQLTACASDSSVNSGKVGQWVVKKMLGTNGYHAMTFVGYDDTVWTDINGNGKVDGGEMGAFKVANTHGTGEAKSDGGFFWMAYDALNAKSSVAGVTNETNRYAAIHGISKVNVDRNFKSSNIYLKYTLNTSNRCDSYVQITAARKSDGATFTRKTSPYYRINQAGGEVLGFDGNTEAVDGTMICDLDNVIPGLNSDNFNDYNWSASFVDSGADSAPLTVKDVSIIDEEAGKNYQFDASFPITVNKNTVTVAARKCYNFSRLAVSPKESISVGTKVKIVAYAENETRGTDPIKYHIAITRDGKQVFAKDFKALGSNIDRVNQKANASVTWTPSKAGSYQATVYAQDASGSVAVRSVSIKVFSSKLSVASVSFDKGRYISPCETVKITPKVTGGKAPYTYSYYCIKDGKTTVLAANSKHTSKTKTFGSDIGTYKIKVQVKDAEGNTAALTRSLVVSPVRISRINYSKDYGEAGDTISITALLRNSGSNIGTANLVYTVLKDNSVTNLSTDAFGSTSWKIPAEGTYTIKAAAVYNGVVMAEKSETYVAAKKDEHANMYKINVNVITYVYNEIKDTTVPYTVRYFNNSGLEGDVKCESLNKTKSYNVGFWGSPQNFYQYVAYVPKTATGYKFHIGDRWFPAGYATGDGSLSTSNTVYVFNYDYDRAVYTKE